MSRARTLSETAAIQEAMLNTLLGLVDAQARMMGQVLEALTTPRPREPAAETFTIKRATVGEKVDVFETNLVRENGETTEQMASRGMQVHERLCARYPLADGRTHVWELDAGTDNGAGSAHAAPLGGDEA